MKLSKRITAALFALAFVFIFSFHAFADTYYYDDGYVYTMPDQNHAVICGVDGDDYSSLSFPELVHYKWVSAVGLYAFSGDEKVTSVSCQNASRMEKISAYAFENCVNLKNVTLAPSINTIGIGAFEGCTSLTSFNWLNAAVQIIPTQAFYGCTSLHEIEIPQTVTSIQPFAFAECSSLGMVTIGDNVTEIADTAFKNDSTVTIACNSNSYAHRYAVDNNIPFVLLDGVKLGDVDGDGELSISDVTDIQRHIALLIHIEGMYLDAADTNRDGNVNIVDVTELQRYLAGYKTKFPIGEYITG